MNQNNGFNNSVQFNNLLMQYMMMNPYQRNMMHNALMMSNRNLAMGFNQPYTLNNVTKKDNNKQNKEIVHYDDDYSEDDSFKEEKKPKVIKHYTKEELEDIEKWINARKRNFPSKNTVEKKDMIGKKREEAGMISKLELKLRKKVSILKKIDSRGGYNNNNGYKKNINNQYNKYQKNQHKNNNKQKKNIIQKANEPLEEGEIASEEEINKTNIDVDEKKEEALIQNTINKEEKKEENTDNNNKNNRREQRSKNKERRAKENFPFRYKHNFLYDNMIKKELIIEENIILQAFRYFINEGLI